MGNINFELIVYDEIDNEQFKGKSPTLKATIRQSSTHLTSFDLE